MLWVPPEKKRTQLWTLKATIIQVWTRVLRASWSLWHFSVLLSPASLRKWPPESETFPVHASHFWKSSSETQMLTPQNLYQHIFLKCSQKVLQSLWHLQKSRSPKPWGHRATWLLKLLNSGFSVFFFFSWMWFLRCWNGVKGQSRASQQPRTKLQVGWKWKLRIRSPELWGQHCAKWPYCATERLRLRELKLMNTSVSVDNVKTHFNFKLQTAKETYRYFRRLQLFIFKCMFTSHGSQALIAF